MVSRQSVEQAIGLSILALVAIGTFVVLRPFLPSIVWAAVLTYSTWPLFVRLKGRLGGREALAATIMILAVACVLVAPVAALTWTMADEVVRLSAIVRGWFETGLPALPSWVGDIPFFGGRLIQRWHDTFQTGDLTQTLAPQIATLRTGLLAAASTVANALVELLLSLVIAFFLYCNGPEIGAAVGSVGDNLTGARGRRLINVVASTIRSVVESLLGTNLLQAILGAIGFWAAGVPGAMLLGFLVFFLTVIPFGAGLIWVPAVIWVANSGRTGTAVLLVGWCIVIFPILENIARPYFVRRGSDLPALLVLLGMLGGMSAFGFLGVFLGPALLALVYALMEEWRTPPARASK
jgi:predicted PurR-regulated permease PerM